MGRSVNINIGQVEQIQVDQVGQVLKYNYCFINRFGFGF